MFPFAIFAASWYIFFRAELSFVSELVSIILIIERGCGGPRPSFVKFHQLRIKQLGLYAKMEQMEFHDWGLVIQ